MSLEFERVSSLKERFMPKKPTSENAVEYAQWLSAISNKDLEKVTQKASRFVLFNGGEGAIQATQMGWVDGVKALLNVIHSEEIQHCMFVKAVNKGHVDLVPLLIRTVKRSAIEEVLRFTIFKDDLPMVQQIFSAASCSGMFKLSLLETAAAHSCLKCMNFLLHECRLELRDNNVVQQLFSKAISNKHVDVVQKMYQHFPPSCVEQVFSTLEKPNGPNVAYAWLQSHVERQALVAGTVVPASAVRRMRL